MILLLILNILFFSSDSLLVKEKEVAGFSNAVSITMDGLGSVYVLDSESNEIIKYNSSLEEIKRIGRKGWNNSEFDNPTYIDGSSGLDIIVSDGNNYRIQRFDLKLGYISSLYTNSETFLSEYKFNRPVATIIVNSNDLYVIDSDNNRVVTFPRGFAPTTTFGDFRAGKGSLQEPVKILKDSENFLYIFDKKRNAIMKYDNFGNFIKSIKADDIKTFSLYNDNLYILNSNGIWLYNTEKNAFIEKKIISEDLNLDNITDLLIYNEKTYLVLLKNYIILLIF